MRQRVMRGVANACESQRARSEADAATHESLRRVRSFSLWNSLHRTSTQALASQEFRPAIGSAAVAIRNFQRLLQRALSSAIQS